MTALQFFASAKTISKDYIIFLALIHNVSNMFRFLYTVPLFLFTINGFAQAQCDCPTNLDQSIQQVELNYAGYPDKVTAKNKADYEEFKNQLLHKAGSATSTKACYLLIKDYVNFFKDKHFRIEYYGKIDSTVVNYYKGDLDQKLMDADALTGYYKNSDSTHIAIIKSDDDTYKAIKVSAVKDTYPQGFVYFTLTPDGNNYKVKLYNRNINIDIPAKVTGNFLKIWSLQLWVREDRELNRLETEVFDSWTNGKQGLVFDKINQEVSYLNIPTFENNDAQIQEVVAHNDSIIRSTPYLIVDLRGNGGGSSGWVSLIPYIATAKITQGENYVRISPENLKKKLPDIAMFVENPIPEGYEKYFTEEKLDAYRKAYKELPETKETFYKTPSVDFPLDSITVNPRKVAVVFDEFGGSSTEYFFSLLKQSGKVKTYGRHTVGMMDYLGMSQPTDLPCEALKLYIPREKSSWTDTAPIDATGFIPETILEIPEEEWIDFVIGDLKD
ncbi:MAG: hypothetical protein CL868_07790 [Cytophagaceae bacterium]|nr:hypothetical protein [Cytophagaceae bacterium]|tara:strand:- start:41167 stop:42663 length:1497 start_codon:yes stop_codon:yes gene_type:complete